MVRKVLRMALIRIVLLFAASFSRMVAFQVTMSCLLSLMYCVHVEALQPDSVAVMLDSGCGVFTANTLMPAAISWSAMRNMVASCCGERCAVIRVAESSLMLFAKSLMMYRSIASPMGEMVLVSPF